jgi:FtsZ-interacting cell division protein YlmF
LLQHQFKTRKGSYLTNHKNRQRKRKLPQQSSTISVTTSPHGELNVAATSKSTQKSNKRFTPDESQKSPKKNNIVPNSQNQQSSTISVTTSPPRPHEEIMLLQLQQQFKKARNIVLNRQISVFEKRTKYNIVGDHPYSESTFLL